MNRFGLRSRLIVAFVVLSVLSAVLVAVTSVVLTRQAMVERATSDAVAGARADLLGAGLAVERSARVVHDDSGRWRVLDELQLARLADELSPPPGTTLVIVQRTGPNYSSSVSASADGLPADLQARVRDGLLARMRVRGEAGQPQLIVGGRVALDALELYRVVDLSPIESDLALVARRAALAAAIPTVLALLAGALVATQVLRPIRRARDAARLIAEGHLEVRIPTSGRDELAELATDFNDMAGSLESTIADLHALMSRQRRFVADVAHELRTPLTALTAAVDVLEQEAGHDSSDRREAMQLVIDEVRALRSMVEDLMEISRFDAGASQLDAHDVSLRTVVDGTLRRRGFTPCVDVDIPPDVRVIADPRRLDAIVGNLAGNAILHGAPPVHITANLTDEGIDLDVADAGPGIPPELHGTIFDRFVKADDARTRTAGSGLGLAIARENARLHDGDVTLKHSGPSGTVFRCHLPVARVASTSARATP